MAELTVLVVGCGSIADGIEAALPGTSVRDRRGTPTDESVVVFASDAWAADPDPWWPADAKVTWLSVRTEVDRVVLGPAVVPGVAGCPTCAGTRRNMALSDRDGFTSLLDRHGAALAQRRAPWLTMSAVDVVAGLVALDIQALAQDPRSARTCSGTVHVHLADLDVRTHRFLPDPLCPVCGTLPPDTAEDVRMDLRPRPKPSAGTYRLRSFDGDRLADLYVDEEYGVVRDVRTAAGGGVVVAAAAMGLRDGRTETGFGRTRGYSSSRNTAVLEALERYGGGVPGGKATTVDACFDDIADRAVDPRDLGLHSREHYRTPGFPFREFTPAESCRWVWAYSFGRREPVLVPEAYAYYRTRTHAQPFVYEISNGCALGSCLEEAILYGILEVAERDAFLLTWYAQLPATPIDLFACRDRLVPMLAETIAVEMGYRITVFDTTAEQGIPCVWALATDTRPAPDRPYLACAAGSHLDPEKGIENALNELGPILHDLIRRFPDERDRARAMAADPTLVTEMHDHSVLYGHPDAAFRLDFLTAERSPRPPREECGFTNSDLRADLLELVDRYLDTGLDVIVVDQTTDEHRAGGLACVKVIIPGTLPMTFGHTYRRIENLRRLRDVPWHLGHTSRPLRRDELNPHPHPFP